MSTGGAGRQEEAGTTASPIGSEEISEEIGGDYLTPLQKSLVYELTKRRDFLASAQIRADFWEKREREGSAARSDLSDLSDEQLDRLLQSRREELTRLKEIKQIEETIVQAADATHVLNRSMIKTAPLAQGLQSALPLAQQPIRYLAAQRDKLALEYLRYDTQLKHIRALRREVAEDIAETRRQTTSLVRDIRSKKEKIQARKESGLGSGTKQNERFRNLTESLKTARDKREMVKGILRGLILESGLDWYGSKELRELMLSLGDDDLEASEEEPEFESDEESEGD